MHTAWTLKNGQMYTYCPNEWPEETVCPHSNLSSYNPLMSQIFNNKSIRPKVLRTKDTVWTVKSVIFGLFVIAFFPSVRELLLQEELYVTTLVVHTVYTYRPSITAILCGLEQWASRQIPFPKMKTRFPAMKTGILLWKYGNRENPVFIKENGFVVLSW